MGFSYLPIWCNLHFMAYEIQFISRLINLRCFDLLNMFELAFRYIDDICILNAPSIGMFLDPSQDRSANNLWWISPLGLVEIKPKMMVTLPENSSWALMPIFLAFGL